MRRQRLLLLAILSALAMVAASAIPAIAATAAPGFAVTDVVTGIPSTGFNGVGPVGLAFDASGQFFVMGYASNQLYRFPNGNGGTAAGHILASYGGGNNYAGIAFDRTGRLFAARQGYWDVIEINPVTGALGAVVANLSCATGIAFDPLSGDMFVTSPCGSGIQRVHNYGTPLVTQTAYGSVGAIDGITFAPDGTLYVAGFGTAIYRMDGTDKPVPGTATLVANVSTSDGVGVAAGTDPTKPPFVFANRNNGTITKIDLTTSPATLTDIVTGGTRGDFAAVGPDGCLYATQTFTVERVTNADGTCSLAPTTVLPTLHVDAGSATATAGSTVPVTVTVGNVTAPAGTVVTFTVTGAHPGTFTAIVGPDKTATLLLTESTPGVDTITVSATINGHTVTGNAVTITWTGVPTTLTVGANSGGVYHDSASLSATLTATTGGAPVAGQNVTLSLGSQSCVGVTSATGVATCSVTVSQAPGSYPTSATFSGNPPYLASSGTGGSFAVAAEDTTLTYNGSLTAAAGAPTTVSATLLEDGTTPLAGRTITFTIGGKTCTGITDAAGVATCSVTGLAVGQYAASASFAGDALYTGSSASSSSSVTVYQSTQFVIWGGDPAPNSVTVGSTHQFWGDGWSRQVHNRTNFHAGGDFKGFACTVTATGWTFGHADNDHGGISGGGDDHGGISGGGDDHGGIVGGGDIDRDGHADSCARPATLPTYISVIITDHVSKLDDLTSGNITGHAVLRLVPCPSRSHGEDGDGEHGAGGNSRFHHSEGEDEDHSAPRGYGPNPGQRGCGIVVALIA